MNGFVGFLNLLEFFFSPGLERLIVSDHLVRVVLLYQLAISLLDLGYFGLFRDSEHLIGLVAALFKQGANALPILNAQVSGNL